MPDLILIAAAVVIAAALVVHAVVESRRVVRPLLDNDSLPETAKWLLYGGWHLISLALAALAALLLWSAFTFPPRGLIIGLTVFLIAAACLSYFAASKGKIHPLRFPATWLFLLSAVLTLTDLLLSGPDMD